MAKASYLGLITCPMCGNENATVHKQETGTKKGRLYFRCYETINGSAMRCGTIQCIGPTGQTFINSNLRPIGQEVSPAPAIEPPQPIGQPDPVEPPKVEPEIQPEPISEPIGDPEPEIQPEPISEPAPVQKKLGLWGYLTQEKKHAG